MLTEKSPFWRFSVLDTSRSLEPSTSLLRGWYNIRTWFVENLGARVPVLEKYLVS